ncbi:hypothetical protein [uncultured Brachyspira sp.]|uniref:hypothetical protein n=1 Tax=uncultured Brachyspira sp. TaxID=221953 RepID=UPI0025EB9812|nr:hypothetical protein [uncultured Brachyspira sp.]
MFEPKLINSLNSMVQSMPDRLIIRYIDKVSIAYLFASPDSRIKIITTQIVSAFINIFILNLYITILYIAVSESMFKMELDIYS